MSSKSPILPNGLASALGLEQRGEEGAATSYIFVGSRGAKADILAKEWSLRSDGSDQVVFVSFRDLYVVNGSDLRLKPFRHII